uniref:Uncharacterized protein n=1 Tax=Anguilla anguilla TaxID=7936 RepID=A0A0E9U918_ANGAN
MLRVCVRMSVGHVCMRGSGLFSCLLAYMCNVWQY